MGGVELKSFPLITRFKTIGQIISVLSQNAFVLAGVLALFLLIFGGIRVILSAGSGDSHGTEQGKKAVVGAVIGLALIVLSYMLMQIISHITGLTILGELFGVSSK